MSYFHCLNLTDFAFYLVSAYQRFFWSSEYFVLDVSVSECCTYIYRFTPQCGLVNAMICKSVLDILLCALYGMVFGFKILCKV